MGTEWQTTDSVFSLPYRETGKPLLGTKLQGDMPGHCGSAPNLLYNFKGIFFPFPVPPSPLLSCLGKLSIIWHNKIKDSVLTLTC